MVLAVDIGGRVVRFFEVFFAWLPHLLAALVVLLIGYFVAKIVGGLVRRLLERAGLDRALHRNVAGSYLERVVPHPAGLLGTLAFWAVFLSAVSLAVAVLGVDALQRFVASIWAYLPNVIAAVLIFLVASLIAGGSAVIARRMMGDTSLGRIVATVLPVLVMTIATFMILDQLKIAHNIVVITYAALIGAVALGCALAFGLGGREVAGEMLRGAYEKGQANAQQWKLEAQLGRERAQRETERQLPDDFPGGPTPA